MVQHPEGVLNDLPVEILDIIMQNLDIPSLLSLGKTNCVLRCVVQRNMVPPATLDRMTSYSEFVVDPGAPVTLVPAVASAAWTPKFTSIIYTAKRDEENQFLDDMRGLSALISRFDFGCLKLLRVRIAFNDTDLEKFQQLERKYKKDWREVLCRLLATAVSAGCTRIEVSNGRLPGPIRGGFGIVWYGLGLFERLRQNIESIWAQFNYNPLPPTTLGTKSLVLKTPFFLSPRFILDTVEDLQPASHTVEHLTISPPDDPSNSDFEIDDWMWTIFTASLRFPHLKSLTIKLPVHNAELRRRTLLQFLSYHPNITTLAIELGCSWEDFSTGSWRPIDEDRPILPRLEFLETQAMLIPWFVSVISRGRKQATFLRLLRGEKWQPPLKSIRILTNDLVENGASLDNAFLSLNGFLPRNPTNIPWCPFLILQINFKPGFWTEYITDNGIGGSSIAHSESRITNLTLEIDSSADAGSPLGVELSLIKDWLAVFPKLVDLEILGRPFDCSATNERLCEVIVGGCLGLKKLRFNSTVMHLGRGEWEAQWFRGRSTSAILYRRIIPYNGDTRPPGGGLVWVDYKFVFDASPATAVFNVSGVYHRDRESDALPGCKMRHRTEDKTVGKPSHRRQQPHYVQRTGVIRTLLAKIALGIVEVLHACGLFKVAKTHRRPDFIFDP
ncbi:hypothetical protein P691DRAFT_790335 [Macrolepiota fuliginosa MF-IS2]|uniref:F-box domain-containing protein n=1 Tax=Macrolepiota fuliginosa MF-IS2 TaxID=1400762 RepID=A0A9P6C6Q3_9AGAR|nr:hypothetical protein P691DRAFT_790335 [Macrolepiota fuliginosa MF-IS2]